MVPRQRVRIAIEGGVPDRVPSIPKIWVDLAGKITNTDLRNIIESPQLALKVIYRAGIEVGVDGVRQFHFPHRSTRQENGSVFEVDNQGNKIGKIDLQGGLRTDLFDKKTFNPEDPIDMAFNHYWTASDPFIETLREADHIAVPSREFYKDFGCKKRQQRIIDKNDREIALIGDCHSATLAFYEEMRGYDRALKDLVRRPDLVHTVMEKGAKIAIERGKFNLDLGLDVLRLNDSIGNMSVISPNTWREFVYPHMKTVCDELHRYEPDARIYCHICGDVLDISKDLVKTGLDCIGPLDPMGGFSPGNIRGIVGDNVALYGGVDTVSFLNKEPEEIVSEAKSCILQAGTEGNYILGSGCVIPRDAKLENLLALSKAARRWGTYTNDQLSSLN